MHPRFSTGDKYLFYIIAHLGPKHYRKGPKSVGFFHISMGHRWRKTPGGGGGAFLQVLVSTPTRRGPTFVCARRRGLCSMLGRYPYGIDNPPTLRRSSFPQRALRPAGGPPYQNTLGAVPQDPLTLKLRLDTNDVNIVRTAPQIRSQGACGAFLCRDCR